MIIGVDTGGTFTDVVVLDGETVRILKLPSTPADPARAILEAVDAAHPGRGFSLIHGTTVATNALLERRGAATGLLTTQGCRDVLQIARQTRSDLYSLCPVLPVTLIPRNLRIEVPERLDHEGAVLVPLDESAVASALDELAGKGVESVAVCFLFSFLNAAHEQTAGRLARHRGLAVSLSSDVAPEFREYERTSTVCANAYVAPVMDRYIGLLGERLRDRGAARFSVMQSNGGSLRAEEAAASAVKTVLSGPAGGVVAAVQVAHSAGLDRIITFDMGGTSTDVTLVDGVPRTVRTGEVAGLPLLTPMLDIHTVGAGGGSIARQDSGGALRVGPESAGADPGPVVYGRGTRLTVTDANVLLGRLPAATRLAGSVPLHAEFVRAHFDELAAALGLTPETAAEGVIRVVNAEMARALRTISTQRGHDPADYTLISFGGAGGLHCCDLAEDLGAAGVLIPRFPGALSALGLVTADVRREYARSFFAPVESVEPAGLRDLLEDLVSRARAELREEGIEPRAVRVEPFVEMRYVGQSYALEVAYRGKAASAAGAFHRTHRQRYGHANPEEPVEIVSAGVRARGSRGVVVPGAELPDREGLPEARLPVYLQGSWSEAPLYRREDLAAGQAISGPAVISQPDATTWIKPGWAAVTDRNANLLLQPTGQRTISA